jgi:hypothetical protein
MHKTDKKKQAKREKDQVMINNKVECEYNKHSIHIQN